MIYPGFYCIQEQMGRPCRYARIGERTNVSEVIMQLQSEETIYECPLSRDWCRLNASGSG
jgi:hypothetical protein